MQPNEFLLEPRSDYSSVHEGRRTARFAETRLRPRRSASARNTREGAGEPRGPRNVARQPRSFARAGHAVALAGRACFRRAPLEREANWAVRPSVLLIIGISPSRSA